MAGSVLTKILGFLKSFLKSMPSPLDGYTIQDAKVNNKDGEYSVLYQFAGKAVTQGKNGETEEHENALKTESGEGLTDVHGNAIQLDLLVSTANVKDAIAPILSGLNNLGSMDKKKQYELMYLLLGTDKYDYSKTDEHKAELEEEAREQASFDTSTKVSDNLQSVMAVESNNDYLDAKNKGTGLLGENLQTTGGLPDTSVTYDGKQWSWAKIAGEYLKYSLECQIPGKDFGAIEKVTESECANLVPEYLIRVGAITNKDEVHIDVVNLIRPILIRLQADMVDYFTDAYNKAFEGKTSAEKEQEEEAQSEAADEAIEDLGLEDETDEGEEFNMAFSKQIKVTLKKIQGSTDFELLGLKSNYSPKETLEDLDDVIIQDEFMNTLTEEPQSFNIDVDDDGYDISTCEDCEINPCDSLGKVLQTGICFYRNLYILHWMSKGNDMMKLHLMTEEMYGELIQEIDTLGELMVEQCGTVISPSFGCDYLEIRSYEFKEGIHILEEYIQDYLDVIDYAYPNQTSDVQSTLDEWLRYWNKQMKYFILRQEE